MALSHDARLLESSPVVDPPIDLSPFNVVRTETVLSRLPIHNLSKRGVVDIHITRKNTRGELTLHWDVSYSEKYGDARQLAYKLDTLIINRRIYEYGRPVPKVIYLGSLRSIARELGLKRDTNKVKKALLQNAFTGISASLYYTAADGTKKKLQGAFTRYEVWFYGEELPDGTTSDAVYIVFHDRYREVLNSAETRPLDYDYIWTLAPTPHRFYELVSYKVYAAMKHRMAEAKMLYSEFCTFAPQQRYYDYDQVKKQMYKVHRPHLLSDYIEKVRTEATTDQDGKPDWILYYIPGKRAYAEYTTFTRERVVPHALPEHATGEGDTQDAGLEEFGTAWQATQLVQHFYQRFHGVEDVVPNAKALTQAHQLLTEYGLEKALFLIDFAYKAAQETQYKIELFGGVLAYVPRAIGAYEQRKEHDKHQEAERRAQWMQEKYEEYRRRMVRAWREAIPPDELEAIEMTVTQQLKAEGKTPHVAMKMMVRVQTDAILEEHAGIITFEDWMQEQPNS